MIHRGDLGGGGLGPCVLPHHVVERSTGYEHVFDPTIERGGDSSECGERERLLNPFAFE